MSVKKDLCTGLSLSICGILCLLTQNAQANELTTTDIAGIVQAGWSDQEIVPNFHKVTTNLYRSGQPEGETAFRSLIERYGIQTIISLRTSVSDQPMAGRLGVRLLQYPIHAFILERENIVKAIRALRTYSRRGPTLLHCEHGSDRTGLITALYRILYDKDWGREEALQEMTQKSYGFHAIWGNIPDYIRNVDIEQLRREVAVP